MAQIPRGIRNNNPLNLIISNNEWLGKVTENTDGHFEQFISIVYGIRAAIMNARTIIRRNKPCSVWVLVKIWAPPNENNTASYIITVCKKVKCNPADVINPNDKSLLLRVLWAMAYVENGQEIPFILFENAWQLIKP